MKRTTLFLMIFIFIFLTACSKIEVSEDIQTQSTDIKNAENKCAALKQSSGELVYTSADAIAQFGGNWKDSENNEKYLSDEWTGNCVYDLNKDPEYLPVITITLESSNMWNKIIGIKDGKLMNTYDLRTKDVLNLGDQALFHWYDSKDTKNPGTLIVKKANIFYNIGCRKCSEEDSIKIAKLILSRKL